MFNPWPFQSEAVDKFFNSLATFQDSHPLIAMPTGTGKSVVIAMICERLLRLWPGRRIMILVHVKELVEQNEAELREIWPEAPTGIYSASLNRRDTLHPIIFGGCDSVVNNVEQFGHIDILLIDEAHLIAPVDNSVYQKIIGRLRNRNPYLRIGGLTATPFRLGQGLLVDTSIFTEVCFDITDYESFNRLIAEGYLAPLIPQPTSAEVDLSEVGTTRADFNAGESDEAVEKILYPALSECCAKAALRDHWIIFVPGIRTTEHASAILNEMGIPTTFVHSKIKKTERKDRVEAYKANQFRCIVNAEILTTGFNYKPIDFIGMLRATMSPGLWVQMLGRGTRVAPGKRDCLVLDFAGNAKRLGPINDPKIPKQKGKGNGDVPIKICPKCSSYNHTRARFCCNADCNFEFAVNLGIGQTAGNTELLRNDQPIIEMLDVTYVVYKKHVKATEGAIPCMKVTYFCGFQSFNEYICFEHRGAPRNNAKEWWRQRFPYNPNGPEYIPSTTDEALQHTSFLRKPSRIRVWVNKRYPEILTYEY